MVFLCFLVVSSFSKEKDIVSDAQYPSRPSRADINLFWNSSGVLEIPNDRHSYRYLPQVMCIVVMSDNFSSRGTYKKPSLKSTSEKHLAWQNLCSCSDSVGIWYIGLRIILLTSCLARDDANSHLPCFFFITSLEHHKMGSTFFMMPAAAYLSQASFSLILLVTGTRWIGICTGEMSLFTLKWS